MTDYIVIITWLLAAVWPPGIIVFLLTTYTVQCAMVVGVINLTGENKINTHKSKIAIEVACGYRSGLLIYLLMFCGMVINKIYMGGFARYDFNLIWNTNLLVLLIHYISYAIHMRRILDKK